jgi:myo-inositol-1(or 4)-monophosphatase
MNGEALQRRFEFASRLIEEAGSAALSYFDRHDELTIKSKGAQDMASEADVDVELLIRNRLKAAFPKDDFLGEETGPGDLKGAPGVWVVDPIEGTQPFVTGMGSWCVSIAFVAEGAVEMGFVTSPVRRETFIAAGAADRL